MDAAGGSPGRAMTLRPFRARQDPLGPRIGRTSLLHLGLNHSGGRVAGVCGYLFWQRKHKVSSTNMAFLCRLLISARRDIGSSPKAAVNRPVEPPRTPHACTVYNRLW